MEQDLRPGRDRKASQDGVSVVSSWRAAFAVFFMLLALAMILTEVERVAPAVIAAGIVACAVYLERIAKSLTELLEMYRSQAGPRDEDRHDSER